MNPGSNRHLNFTNNNDTPTTGSEGVVSSHENCSRIPLNAVGTSKYGSALITTLNFDCPLVSASYRYAFLKRNPLRGPS